MASHTPSELRIAARVLGEAARALGLDPSSMGRPLLSHEEEPAHTPGADRRISEADELAAAPRARERVPFDAERTEEDRDLQPVAVAAHEPQAPFDYERESRAARAA